ncbi:hypothetical protein JRQ81_018989, partial [Phrynocephalus forsythii]
SVFTAAPEACRELMWLKKLLKDFGIHEETQFQVMEENQSCFRLSQTEKMNAMKQIGMRHQLVHDMTEKCTIQMIYCPTAEMSADNPDKACIKKSFPELVKHGTL